MRVILVVFAATLATATSAYAHPAPFSSVDVRMADAAVELTVVAHVFDVAHDLGLAQMERLLDPAGLSAHADAVTRLLDGRLRVTVDGTRVTGIAWTQPEPLADRQSVRIRGRFAVSKPPDVLSLWALLFPYDPAHQTFVNVYQRESLFTQAILDAGRQQVDYF